MTLQGSCKGMVLIVVVLRLGHTAWGACKDLVSVNNVVISPESLVKTRIQLAWQVGVPVHQAEAGADRMRSLPGRSNHNPCIAFRKQFTYSSLIFNMISLLVRLFIQFHSRCKSQHQKRQRLGSDKAAMIGCCSLIPEYCK